MWYALTFGRACAQVAGFALIIAVVCALLQPNAPPERAFGLVLGEGLALLALFAFQQRRSPLPRLAMQVVGLGALTIGSGVISVAILGALL